MVTFVSLEEQISMRVEWRSAITDSGELSVMIHGVHQMPGWPVGSLAIQEFVSSQVDICKFLSIGLLLEPLITCSLLLKNCSYTVCVNWKK